MPESNQPSSPPPAYINHGDVSATHIEILHINSEGGPTEPISPQTASNAREITENQVPVTQPVDKQDLIDLTNPIPDVFSSAVESNNPTSNKLLSKLEQTILRLESSQADRLITRLEDILSRQAEADATSPGGKKDTRKPIKFKDAVGRRFSFPYYQCETWAGIEQLIKAAFVHVDIIGPHVNEGHYDIMNPAGEVILPQLWEDHVQPGWEISMSMWPISSPKPRFPPPPPQTAPVHVIVDRLPGPPPPPPPPPPHFLPRYHSDDDSIVSKKKGMRGLWQKMKGIFTKKKATDYDSDGSGSLADD